MQITQTMSFLDNRKKQYVLAVFISLVLGVVAGYSRYQFDGDFLKEHFDYLEISIHIVMHGAVFILGFIVRATPWIWGVAMKAGQFIFEILVAGGTGIPIGSLVIIYLFSTVPLVLTGLFGAWMSRAESVRMKIIVFGCLCVLLAAETGAWNLLRVDKCLDRGGRWNHELANCEY